MWENCHDYDAEVEAQMKQKRPDPIDIPRLRALLAGATRFYANGRIELTHDDETARRWAVVIFEAFPALLAELKDLRARVAELENFRQETERQYQYKITEISDLLSERDRLRAELENVADARAKAEELVLAERAERDAEIARLSGYNEGLIRDHSSVAQQLTAANDTTAGMREDMHLIKHLSLAGLNDPGNPAIFQAACRALARTPSQHRDRIVAAGLREAHREICAAAVKAEDSHGLPLHWSEAATLVHDMAERLERGE